MLLVLDDEHKQHLSFLTNGNPPYCKDFCMLATDFLLKGINWKAFSTASQKLGVDVSVVRNAVLAVMQLLTESSRLCLSELELQDSLISLGFQEDSWKDLVQWYNDNRQKLLQIMNKTLLDSPRFKDLDWRFDVQLASRNLRHQVTPIFELELTLQNDLTSKDDSATTDTRLRLQTDPSNLLHMTQVLEQALKEAKSHHTQRIARNLK